MKADQKQNLESFVRVSAFVDANPVSGPLTYAGPREILQQVIQRLREHAGAQLAGRDLSRGEVRRQQQLVQRLIDRHVRPIVAIARGQFESDSDIRMAATIRMPRGKPGVTKVIQTCDGLFEAARPFAPTLIAHGLPADFLAQFTEARNALESSLGGRETLVNAHIAARAALAAELRRGRAAVRRIDSVVRASFGEEPVVMTAWRAASRVRLLPGGVGRNGREGTTDERTTQLSETEPSQRSTGALPIAA